MFDGTWAGDAGFDPLSISGWLDPRYAIYSILLRRIDF
jgi:hypothetical protein